MRLIDSHVNLHADAFSEDLGAVIERARAAGVARMLTICDRMDNAPAVDAVAEGHDGVFASLGAHPHYAKDHQWLTAGHLVDRIATKTVGIGETGLDLHYRHSCLDDQVAVFRQHIEAARKTGLPLIVHTREADQETGQILTEEFERGAFPLLLHCYTSGPELAALAYRLGGYISFSGILTFKGAEAVRTIAHEAPLDRIILETDCPYLAPVPHRGRRCEPAMVRDVYTAFAALRGLELEAVAARVWDNFHRLFRGVPT